MSFIFNTNLRIVTKRPHQKSPIQFPPTSHIIYFTTIDMELMKGKFPVQVTVRVSPHIRAVRVKVEAANLSPGIQAWY